MGIKKNFLYSSALTISNYIFPLLIFPYISRVLGVTNIGICDFVDSIINYYVLFSMMGMHVIGIREIAKNKTSPLNLNKTFSDLFILNIITTLLVLVIFFIALYTVPQLYQHKELMYIGAVKIIFNLFLIEWFYRGIENFRFITIRTIIVKTLYVISIFILVNKESDYNIYYALTAGMIVINAVINWIYKRNFVRLDLMHSSIRTYSKPYFINGLYMLLTSMYTSFNVAFLGFVSGEKQVGYYSTAIKLYTIFLAVFTAFSNVMMPRMSVLVSEGKLEELKGYMNKSFDVLLAFSLPLIFITVPLAPDIIYIIAGSGYEGAVIPMKIIMPLILIVGIAQILIIQILIPAGYDKIILFNSIVGAVVGIVMNILLVKYYGSIGSAVVVLAAELIVTVSAAFWIKKYLNLLIPYKKILFNILISIPYIAICIMSQQILSSPFLICVIAIGFSGVYFLISQIYILKNQIVIASTYKIKEYLNRYGK